MSEDAEGRILHALEVLLAGQESLQNAQMRLVGLIENLSNGLQRLRVEVMARIDAFQEAVISQREEAILSQGAAERAETIAKSAQGEVRAIGEQVNSLIRQMRRLQAEIRQLRGEPEPSTTHH
jgi:vacuolar-type H+-ATPase subunit I/STV1